MRKLDPRGVLGRFVGYSEDASGYLVWVPSAHQIVESIDVRFLEHLPLSIESGQLPYDGSPIAVEASRNSGIPAPSSDLSDAVVRDLMLVNQMRELGLATPSAPVFQPPISPSRDQVPQTTPLAHAVPVIASLHVSLPSPVGGPQPSMSTVSSSIDAPDGWGAAHPVAETHSRPLSDSTPGLIATSANQVECIAVGPSDNLIAHHDDCDVDGLILVT